MNILKGSRRVLRGGSWNRFADYSRVAFRSFYSPDYRRSYIGFRMCMVGEI